MWNKLWKFGILGFFCAQCVGCAGNRSEESAEPLKSPVCGEKHLLWKAEKSGAPAVWLLGSIHLADSSFYPFAPVIDSAFDASSLLAAELDLTEESTMQETGRLMAEKGRLPAGVKLDSILPQELYAELDSVTKAWNIPLEILKPFRPWMIALSLSAVAIERTGLSGEYGIDKELLFRAEDQNKKVFAIETPGEQVSIFSDAEDSLGVRYLKNTLDEITHADSLITEIANAWKCGDVPKMQRIFAMDKTDADYEEELYVKRNVRMANAIDSLAALGEEPFIVVGCAHLVGSGDNVLRLLEKKGYRIRQR
ncbi:MAG: TraB/GumN family protein [Hallerella succinigenes]|nr:TraB/GumN family protein [Hallerella succinigenes]